MDSSKRTQPDLHHAPYLSSYDPHAAQHSSYVHDADLHNPHPARSPMSPNDAYPQPSQQPLKNALNNAFDKSDTAGKVHPDLIAQITAEVKKSVLDEIKLGMGVPPQPVAPPPQQTYPPPSPISMGSIPPRNLYTPPSPKQADLSSQGSLSPDPLSHEPLFDGTGETPPPRQDHAAPVDIPQGRAAPRRPAAPQRMPTEGDFSPIERRWQRLFDLQGQPTPRLGEFLRGLALHLINDYEPKNSLVISPSKMLRFYNDVRLNEENYPWDTIFGSLPYSTLCKIYRDMRCEHYLIQEHAAAQPDIPALTPHGFREWMTAMIQAYPDAEYKRLSRAVLEMPISNADDVTERFPKDIPRRLFPQAENLQAQQRCAAALSSEGVGPLRRAPTFPPPPPMSHSASVPPSLERERNPYSARPEQRAAISEDEDNVPPSIPLERERKPYAAAPGGGKVYEGDKGRKTADAGTHDQRRQNQSTASQTPFPGPTDPSQHPWAGKQASGRRPRSPNFTGYGKSSDLNVAGGYYTSDMYDEDEDQRRFAKDAEMRRNGGGSGGGGGGGGHQRRSTAGPDTSYDPQSRSVYDDDYHRGRGYDGRNGYESRRY